LLLKRKVNHAFNHYSVIEFEATPEGAPTLAVTGRTTVMAPARASTAGGAT